METRRLNPRVIKQFNAVNEGGEWRVVAAL